MIKKTGGWIFQPPFFLPHEKPQAGTFLLKVRKAPHPTSIGLFKLAKALLFDYAKAGRTYDHALIKRRIIRSTPMKLKPLIACVACFALGSTVAVTQEFSNKL